MLNVLNVVSPVFAVVIFGFLAVRFKLYPASGVAGLITFVNSFATPFLLFRAMLGVDFGTAFNPKVIGSFYFGAVVVFAIGMPIAIKLFRNRPGVAVAAAFSGTFSNGVLLGIPIIQRAYGEGALQEIYTILGLHAPILMSSAMIVMELSRRDGRRLSHALIDAVRRAVSNPLLIGIALGLLGNLAGLALIEPADAFTRIMAQAVLPAALFGLGGALNQYRIRENGVQSLTHTTLKLMVHPLIVWLLLVPVFRLDHDIARAAVVLSAMPAGINTYVFATMYRRAEDIAASTILLTTSLSIFSVSFWLYVMS